MSNFFMVLLIIFTAVITVGIIRVLLYRKHSDTMIETLCDMLLLDLLGDLIEAILDSLSDTDWD